MLDKERPGKIWVQIRQVLMREWDPIGVKGLPQAQDEYDSYIGDIYELLVGGASEKEVAEYLLRIEYERMGLAPHDPELILPTVRALRAINLNT